MFEGSIKGISRIFQGSFKGVTRKIEGYSERTSRVIQGRFKGGNGCRWMLMGGDGC